jgi:hypothetical protein
VSKKMEGDEAQRRRARDVGAQDRSRTNPAAGAYTQAHEQVFEALSGAQQEHRGKAVHLDEVARAAESKPRW